MRLIANMSGQPHETLAEMIGLIPMFLDDDDPDNAVTQLDKNYQHGGGWRDMEGFTFEPKTAALKYPGDPDLKPLAAMALREEMVVFYPYGIVAVVQENDTFRVARMD